MDIIALTFYFLTLGFCFVFTYRHWKLRGKTYDELTEREKGLVIKALSKEYGFRRNKYTPETYLPRLQKLAVFTLVISIIYAAAGVYFIYFLSTL